MRLFVLLLMACQSVLAQVPSLEAEQVLKDLPVHKLGDQSVFATRFDYRDGMLFLVQVEAADPGLDEQLNLKTVIYKGIRQANASWRWTRKVIDARTLLDPWHTQASVALDRRGHVHVAYNMHNMPWQYSVSRRPYDISDFEFKGQALTVGDREQVKVFNRTPFPTEGSAAIPGNQITYPMFFTDRLGELYVTYRFALRPGRNWNERGFGGGVARYSVEQKRWTPIGGEVEVAATDVGQLGGTRVVRPFVYQEGYSTYLIALAFDAQNGMHAFWNWRQGGAGEDTVSPSYGYSNDGLTFRGVGGAELKLPIARTSDSALIRPTDDRKFHAYKSVAAELPGTAAAIFHPIGAGRVYVEADAVGHTRDEAPTPESASTVVIDDKGREWLFATGIRVFMRAGRNQSWEYKGRLGDSLCYPTAKFSSRERVLVLHAKNCGSGASNVFMFAP